MGRGVIDFPVQRAAEVIQDMHLVHNWERYLVVSKSVACRCVAVDLKWGMEL